MIKHKSKSLEQVLFSSFFATIGAFLAAYSIEVFLVPNQIIDGGIIGISILISRIFSNPSILYPLVVILNLPFVFLAYKSFGRSFVIQMMISVIAFALLGAWIEHSQLPIFSPYRGDLLEIVVTGGLILGLGVGLIIRSGGCLDGTEILGILVSKRYGFTVGNIVLAANLIIFAFAGVVFGDWHAPIQSLITFFIVIKIMDMVIVGLDEMKAVTIFSKKPKVVSEALLHELGLGLTVISARGGYTGEQQDLLYLIAERLQLAEIKNIVQAEDPKALIAIENLHEVTSGNMTQISTKI